MENLSKQEEAALLEALDDEYKAWATYDQVIRDFGEVRPFINIREAEGRHIEALLGLLRLYEIAPPPNQWVGNTVHYGSVSEACRAGVQAEIANAALYERLLRLTAKEDILTVYRALHRASQEHHLPAFQRCAERGQP
jgi:hypothetical protein